MGFSAPKSNILATSLVPGRHLGGPRLVYLEASGSVSKRESLGTGRACPLNAASGC